MFAVTAVLLALPVFPAFKDAYDKENL